MFKKSQYYYYFIISLFAFSAILRSSSRFEKAVKKGVKAVEDLITNQGVGINDKDKYYETLLGYASKLGLIEVVQYLTQQNGIDLNKYYSRSTPLMYACDNGHLDVVKELVEKGADATLVIKNRFTAIQLAAWEKHYNIVDYLLTSDKITWKKEDLEKLMNFFGKDTPLKTIENLYNIPALNNDIQQPIKNAQYEIVKHVVEKRKRKLTKKEINQLLPSLAGRARLDKITELLQNSEIKRAFDPTTQDDQEQTFLDYLISYYRDKTKNEVVMTIIKFLTKEEIIELEKESKKIMLLAAKSSQHKLFKWAKKNGTVNWENCSREDINRLLHYLAKNSQATTISQLVAIEQVKSKFEPTQELDTGIWKKKTTFINHLFGSTAVSKEEKTLQLIKKLVQEDYIQLEGKTGKIAILLTAQRNKVQVLNWLRDREEITWNDWSKEEVQTLFNTLCEYKKYHFIKILYGKEGIGQQIKDIMSNKQKKQWFRDLLSDSDYHLIYSNPENDEKNILNILALVEESQIDTLFQEEKDRVKKAILSFAEYGTFKILKWMLGKSYITGEKWSTKEANELFRCLAANGEDGIFKQLLAINKMKTLFTISPIEEDQGFPWGSEPDNKFFSDYLLKQGTATKKQQKGKLNILKIVIDNNLINLEEQKEQINIQVAKENRQRAIAKYLKSLNSSNLGPENENNSDDSSNDDSSIESGHSSSNLDNRRNEPKEDNLNNDSSTDDNNSNNSNNHNSNLPNHTSNGIRLESYDDTRENNNNILNNSLDSELNQISTDGTFWDNSNSNNRSSLNDENILSNSLDTESNEISTGDMVRGNSNDNSNNELNKGDNHMNIKFIFQVVGISAAAILLLIALPYHFFIKKKKEQTHQ